jgi:hypothetical protein
MTGPTCREGSVHRSAISLQRMDCPSLHGSLVSPVAGERQLGVNGGRFVKRYSGCSMPIALLVVVGLLGVAVAQQPKSGGALRVAWGQDVTGFDPNWSEEVTICRDTHGSGLL